MRMIFRIRMTGKMFKIRMTGKNAEILPKSTQHKGPRGRWGDISGDGGVKF